MLTGTYEHVARELTTLKLRKLQSTTRYFSKTFDSFNKNIGCPSLPGNVINNDDINLDPSLSSKGEELKQLQIAQVYIGDTSNQQWIILQESDFLAQEMKIKWKRG